MLTREVDRGGSCHLFLVLSLLGRVLQYLYQLFIITCVSTFFPLFFHPFLVFGLIIFFLFSFFVFLLLVVTKFFFLLFFPLYFPRAISTIAGFKIHCFRDLTILLCIKIICQNIL